MSHLSSVEYLTTSAFTDVKAWTDVSIAPSASFKLFSIASCRIEEFGWRFTTSAWVNTGAVESFQGAGLLLTTQPLVTLALLPPMLYEHLQTELWSYPLIHLCSLANSSLRAMLMAWRPSFKLSCLSSLLAKVTFSLSSTSLMIWQSCPLCLPCVKQKQHSGTRHEELRQKIACFRQLALDRVINGSGLSS